MNTSVFLKRWSSRITRQHTTRLLFTLSKHNPPSNAPRMAPYPLVWVSATDWDTTSGLLPSFFSLFLNQGFICLDIDISLPETSLEPSALMRYYESELKRALDTENAAFAPVICARHSATLIAQTYISSHPATAMVLMSPPAHNTDVTILSGHLSEFNFEPRFPIAVVAAPQVMERLRKESRLGKDPGVDQLCIAPSDATTAVVEWLDECGI